MPRLDKLVADVGGTSSRLALSAGKTLDISTVRTFRNNRFSCFEDLVRDYFISVEHPKLNDCCIAVAGPVKNNSAEVTNLDWVISGEKICEITHCRKSTIINDLTALGLAVPRLPADHLEQFAGLEMPAEQDGQKLVVGVGTGFNVCPVLKAQRGVHNCAAAEIGHMSMPISVHAALEQCLLQENDQFHCLEDLFSGKGLSNFHMAMTGDDHLSGEEIVSKARDNTVSSALWTATEYAGLLGEVLRELSLAYLPYGGVYFCGSVTKNILSIPAARQGFLKRFQRTGGFLERYQDIPLWIVTEDIAALYGCAVLGE